MISRSRFPANAVAVVCAAAAAVAAVAGELTTDNLKANQEAKLWGNLTAKDGGAGSASTNGLLLYYSFSTNTTPVPDDSGNGSTGTVSGATWVTNGSTGGAYSFDGSNDKITAPNSNSWNFSSNDFTISMWVNFVTTASGGGITSLMGHDQYAQAIKWTWIYGYKEANKMGFNICDGTNEHWVSFAWSPSTATWYHILLSRASNSWKFYVNGVQTGGTQSNSLIVPNASAALTIGNEGESYSFLNGKLDEIRVYNRALSAAEAVALYLYDAHLTTGSTRFETGMTYLQPGGDVSQGIYTNGP